MNNLVSEIVREFRWAVSSRLALAIVVAALVFAGWSATTDIGNASSATAQFRQTADAYAAAGQSVQAALDAPLNVRTDGNGQSDIDNPVRYDFEAALAAAGALAPAGSMSTALSLALFIFVPLVSYAMGLFALTSDLKSGSIISRWPQVKQVWVFVASKAVMLCATVVTLGVALSLWALCAGFVTSQMQPLPTDSVPMTATPGLGRGLGLLGVLLLVGIAFSSIGAIVGSLSRERVFSLVVFALGYYLVPIVGTWDVRNLIPGVAGDLLAFYGGFQPRVVGDVNPASSAGALAALAGLLLLGSWLTWVVRDKTPAAL